MNETVKLGAVFGAGWRLMKSHFFVTLGIMILFVILSVVLEILSTIGLIGMVFALLSLVVGLVFSAGLTGMTINAVDGEEPYWAIFKEVLPRVWQYFLGNLLVSVMALVSMVVVLVLALSVGNNSFAQLEGLFDYYTYLQEFHPDDVDAISSVTDEIMSILWLPLLLAYLPVFYLSLRFFFAPYLIIDRNMQAVEAVKLSWKSTAYVQGKVLLFLILSFLLNFLGVLCFFVGIFVTMIITLYAQAALYRQIFPAGMQEPLVVEKSAEMVVD